MTQDMKQAAVSPNNTFGLTEQVDHIVAECQEDEYRVKTLLHSSAILTQQHQAKMEQGKEASGAGWRSVFNRVPEWRQVPGAVREFRPNNRQKLLAGAAVGALVLIIGVSVGVSVGGKKKSRGVAEVTGSDYGPDPYGAIKYERCITGNRTVDGTNWWTELPGHPTGALPAYGKPEEYCYNYCMSELAGQCQYFAYLGTEEKSCKFVRDIVDIPAMLTSYVDVTAGLRVYDAQCMSNMNLKVRADLVNPGDINWEPTSPSLWGEEYNYGEVLGRSYEFYEAQWAGPQPEDYRVEWRTPGYADACGKVGGGNFHDGSHVQAMLPTATTVANQILGLLWWQKSYEFTAYDGRTNREWADREIAHSLDWMERAWDPKAKHLLIAVGAERAPDGGDPPSLSYYGKAEGAPTPGCTYATPDRPASDVTANTAAAFALASILYREKDPARSERLKVASTQLLEFSMEHETTAVASNFFVGKLYPSYDPNNASQHRFWAGCLLYQATNDAKWWDLAMAERVRVESRLQRVVSNWNNVMWLGTMCMAQSAPDAATRDEASTLLWEGFVQEWTFADQDPIMTTDGIEGGGFHFAGAFVGEYREDAAPDTADDQGRLQEGMFRDSMNAAMIALMWASLPGMPEEQVTAANCFAKYQVAYVLGDNDLQQSYVVGWTSDVALSYPDFYQSRDAFCQAHYNCTAEAWADPGLANPPAQVLQGALLSSVEIPSENYPRTRTLPNSVVNIEFNAGFSGALAGLAYLPRSFWEGNACEPDLAAAYDGYTNESDYDELFGGNPAQVGEAGAYDDGGDPAVGEEPLVGTPEENADLYTDEEAAEFDENLAEEEFDEFGNAVAPGDNAVPGADYTDEAVDEFDENFAEDEFDEDGNLLLPVEDYMETVAEEEDQEAALAAADAAFSEDGADGQAQ